MLALIDPRFDRVCQVEEISFPVADPLFWVECPEECDDSWTYVNNEFVEPNMEV